MNALLSLTRLETLAFLRSKTTLFWTFAYPIVLLVMLYALFGGSAATRTTVQVENLSQSNLADRIVETIEQRLAYVDGFDIDFEFVEASTPLKGGEVRVVIPEGTTDTGGDVRLAFEPPVSPNGGAAISMVSEVVEIMNREAATDTPAWAFSYGSAAPAEPSEGSGNGAGFLITGMAALTIISTALFGFTGVLIQLRHSGALKPFQIMPVKQLQYVTAFSVSRIVVLMAFTLGFVCVFNLVYRAGMTLSGSVLLLTALVSLVGIFAFLGIGLLIASLITSPATGQALINTLNIPIIFLSDLFIPVSSMPEWLQSAVAYSPINAFVNLLRHVLDGQALEAGNWAVLGVLMAIGVASYVISMKTFKWRVA